MKIQNIFSMHSCLLNVTLVLFVTVLAYIWFTTYYASGSFGSEGTGSGNMTAPFGSEGTGSGNMTAPFGSEGTGSGNMTAPFGSEGTGSGNMTSSIIPSNGTFNSEQNEKKS